MSSVLLMRMNLPAEYREAISAILGDIQFGFYDRWYCRRFFVLLCCMSLMISGALMLDCRFDEIFVVAATCSIVIMFLQRKSRVRPKDRVYMQ